MADAATRTERATPKRREEARRHGQVVVSSEISPVAVLCMVLVAAAWGAPMLVDRVSLVLVDWLAAAGRVVGEAPLDWWRRAFSLTYSAELRAERKGRSGSVVDADADRYARFSAPAAAAIEPDSASGGWARRRVRSRWPGRFTTCPGARGTWGSWASCNSSLR